MEGPDRLETWQRFGAPSLLKVSSEAVPPVDGPYGKTMPRPLMFKEAVHSFEAAVYDTMEPYRSKEVSHLYKEND